MRPLAEDHVKKVRAWLEKNVLAPVTPSTITVSKIRFSWRSLQGSFKLSLDDKPIKGRFDLYIDIAGQIQFCPPMFCSPLGAPCSYAAVDLDPETEAALTRALQRIFPRIRGYGVYQSLGLEIYGDNPLKDRIIDIERFTTQRALIRTPGFSYKESVLV